MTLTALAKELHTTTMTIYRKLQREGLNIADLRDDVTGELSSQGIAVISSLFDHTTPTDTTPSTTPDATQTEQNAGSDVTTIAVLTAKLEGADAIIAQLAAERDDLRARLDAMTAALEREQQDRQAERQQLLAPGAEPPPRHRWFSWFRKSK